MLRMTRTLDSSQPWEEIEQSFRSHMNNIRRARKAGFTFETSHEQADFDYFYDRMHLPYINQRHRGYGMIEPKTELQPLFEKGFVTFVKTPDGKRIAGDLNALWGDVFFSFVVGILDGDSTWVQSGALSAMYYHLMETTYHSSASRYDLGAVRPFLKNGLFQYKRRWGFAPIRQYWNPHEWLIWVPGNSTPALRWMEANPFVPEFARTGGAQTSKIVSDAPSSTETEAATGR